MENKYDIIVIGAGSGGLNIAMFSHKIGLKTLLIDKTDENIGGDCLNYGCVPSKALIHVSKLVYNARESEKFGLQIKSEVDIKKVVDYIKSKKEIIREHENARYFKKMGLDLALGEAEFVGKREVEVSGKTYKGKKIVIATGSRPKSLDIPGLDKKKLKVYNNESIFDLKKIPKTILVAGGGPIGMEISQALGRLGSKVIVVKRDFLGKEDEDIKRVLFRQMTKEGVEFHPNCVLKEFQGKIAVIERQDGKKSKRSVDAIFVAIGRDLNIPKGLEKSGIKTEDKGRKIKVDEYMRTTNKNVLLCGDVAGGLMFTHAAELHASVILNNFFSPIKKKLDTDNFSWVTYTQPEIASFGISERVLKDRGISYEKLKLDFEDDDRSIVDDFREGKLILFVGKDQRILGGSMVAMNAGELFQELVLAKTAGLKTKDIFNKLYSYPTASRVNKKIIANSFSGKLTEKTKGLLRFLYGLFS